MMAVAAESAKRGGRRPGSGRKRRFEERVKICFDVSQETRDQLDALAAQLGKTRADLIRDTLWHLLKTDNV